MRSNVAIAHHERVGKALELLKYGLDPHVGREFVDTPLTVSARCRSLLYEGGEGSISQQMEVHLHADRVLRRDGGLIARVASLGRRPEDLG